MDNLYIFEIKTGALTFDSYKQTEVAAASWCCTRIPHSPSVLLLLLQVRLSIWRGTLVMCVRQSFQPEPPLSICAGRASPTSSPHDAACCSLPSECFIHTSARFSHMLVF